MKYQEYWKSQDLKEEIFKMNQKGGSKLEDYVERFQYNLQLSPHSTLGDEVLKKFLI